jgi:hypothetical protein
VYTKLNINISLVRAGIGTAYGLEDRGVGFRSRAHPASYPIHSNSTFTGGSFHEIKRPGREAARGEEFVDLYIHSLIRHHGLLVEHKNNVILFYHQQIRNYVLLNLFRCRKEPTTRSIIFILALNI